MSIESQRGLKTASLAVVTQNGVPSDSHILTSRNNSIFGYVGGFLTIHATVPGPPCALIKSRQANSFVMLVFLISFSIFPTTSHYILMLSCPDVWCFRSLHPGRWSTWTAARMVCWAVSTSNSPKGADGHGPSTPVPKQEVLPWSWSPPRWLNRWFKPQRACVSMEEHLFVGTNCHLNMEIIFW